MWFLDWLTELFRSFGFLERKVKLVLVGLDNAGKTTLLGVLRTGKVQRFFPTQRAKEETVQVSGVTFSAWDLGGHDIVRHVWDEYLEEAGGAVFVLDGADLQRWEEGLQELCRVHALCVEKGIPLSVLLNKSDIQGYLELDQLSFEMGQRGRPFDSENFQAFSTSLVEGKGYKESLQWLASKV